MYQREREPEAQQREGQEEPTGLLIFPPRIGIQGSEVQEGNRGRDVLGYHGEGPGGGLRDGAIPVGPVSEHHCPHGKTEFMKPPQVPVYVFTLHTGHGVCVWGDTPLPATTRASPGRLLRGCWVWELRPCCPQISRKPRLRDQRGGQSTGLMFSPESGERLQHSITKPLLTRHCLTPHTCSVPEGRVKVTTRDCSPRNVERVLDSDVRFEGTGRLS